MTIKNKEQFDNSIKVLVKAYLEGTLEHGVPCACAVGNLIGEGKRAWYDIVSRIKLNFDLPSATHDEGISEIKSTGYKVKEIVRIEKAFERVTQDPDGYKGLCAVFDVLVKIHQGSDKELELAKEQLVKQ